MLYARWRGFAPPGTSTLLPLAGTPCEANAAGCAYVALCPTMRFPESVAWHHEIVYNCVWSLLVAIDEHNARVEELEREKQDGEGTGNEEKEGKEERRIESVVMTGLATGVGRVPVAECAKQMALAFAHYHEAKTNPERWSSLSWNQICRYPLDVKLPTENRNGSGWGYEESRTSRVARIRQFCATVAGTIVVLCVGWWLHWIAR